MHTGTRIFRRLHFNLYSRGRSLVQVPLPELEDKKTEPSPTDWQKISPFDMRLYIVPAGIVGCIIYPQYMVEIFTDLGCLGAGSYVAAKEPRIPKMIFRCVFPLLYWRNYNHFGRMGLDHDGLGYAAGMLAMHDYWKAAVLAAVLLAVLLRCLLALYFSARDDDDEKPIGRVSPFELPECSGMPE